MGGGMKFIIYGAGALGSFIGGILSKKFEVLLIGRERHIRAIEKNGLIIEGITTGIFHPKVRWHGEKYDLIILTTKAYDTENALKEAREKFGTMPVLSLQNGLGNEEKIARIMGKENAIGGITTHGVTFIEPGRIRHAGYGKTIIGEMYGKSQERVRKIAECFNEAGIETEISENIRKEIWKKAIINSAINPLTAIFKCKNKELLKYRSILKKICEEGVEIARKEGFEMENVFDEIIETIKKTGENFSSMLQDIKRGKKTEIDEINGEIARIAKKHGMEACYNSVLTHIIKEMENVGT